VIQVAELAGTPRIVFVVTLFASLVAVEIDRRRGGAPSAWVVPLLVLAVALGYGALRLAIRDAAATVTVGLAALDVRPEDTGGHELWAAYGRAIDQLAERGARIIVLPEKIVAVDVAAAPALQRRLGALAEYYGVTLVAGVAVVGDGRRENRAWLFGPAGGLAADYSKQHLIPGLEAAFTPGRVDAVQVVNAEILGVAICKDLDFPALGQRYGVKDARLMLVPAWDFRRDDWQHARMAILRGVESGFTVVRAARDGLLTISDRHGRVLTQATSAQGRMTLALGPAPRGAPTLYVELGDVFGWVCVVLALIVWVRALQFGAEKPAS
jgi:apolipoprotein N-acyltransferase